MGVGFLDREDPLEKGMATHSSILENPMTRGDWWSTVPACVLSCFGGAQLSATPCTGPHLEKL